MFVRIGSILKKTPRRSKSPDAFLALQVRQVAKEVLERICEQYPEDIGKTVKVKTFKNGTLTVASPTLLSAELHARSEGLKEDINGVLGKKIVEKIRFKAN